MQRLDGGRLRYAHVKQATTTKFTGRELSC